MELFVDVLSLRRMAQPGRKPIDYRELDHWEFQCFRAFHSLCKGTALPVGVTELSDLQKEIDSASEALAHIRRLTISEFWIEHVWDGDNAPPLNRRTVVKEFGPVISSDAGTPKQVVAEQQAALIASLESDVERLREALVAAQEQRTEAREVRARSRSYEVWQLLWHAATANKVVEACRQWDALPEPFMDRLISAHVVRHNAAFVEMKRDKRFPRSKWGDDARIAYLARGMAGAIAGYSPLTAIERLRKLTHEPGSALWFDYHEDPIAVLGGIRRKATPACRCWRCRELPSRNVLRRFLYPGRHRR